MLDPQQQQTNCRCSARQVSPTASSARCGVLEADLKGLARKVLALVLRDLLESDIPLGFGSGRGNNVYEARVRGIERFWLQCPDALAPFPSHSEKPGPARWKPPRALGLAGIRGLIDQEVKGAAEAWVKALHETIARHKTLEESSPKPDSPGSEIPDSDGSNAEPDREEREARSPADLGMEKRSGSEERPKWKKPGARKPRFPLQRSNRKLAVVPLESLDQALAALPEEGSAWGFRTLPDEAMLERRSFAEWRKELGKAKLLEARIFSKTLDLHWLGDRGLLLADPSAIDSEATVGGEGWLERDRDSRLWGEWLEGSKAWYEARIPDPLCYKGLDPGPENCVPSLRYREWIRCGSSERIVQYIGVEGKPREEGKR